MVIIKDLAKETPQKWELIAEKIDGNFTKLQDDKLDASKYNLDKNTFALKTELPSLKGYAKETWVTEQINSKLSGGTSLEGYVKTETLTSILKDYAKTSDLSKYALNSGIPTKLSQLSEDDSHKHVTQAEKNKWDNKQDKGDYALKSDLTKYAETTTVNNKADKTDLGGLKFHKCTESEYATLEKDSNTIYIVIKG